MNRAMACVIGALVASAATHSACGSDQVQAPAAGDSGPDDAAIDSPADQAIDTTADAAHGPLPPPKLGTQIDRAGRPFVNTALDHAFDPDTTTQGQRRDAYNADPTVASWPATYAPEIARNLAVLDGFDAKCGNQIAYGVPAGSAYATLAAMLADDRLWLDTSQSACTRYLALERSALGWPASDCGGRAPGEDVIDETYSLLVAGTTSGVTDGIAAPASPPSATFPYLAQPH